jgi:transcriptional regulator with XRE-family HTH domain
MAQDTGAALRTWREKVGISQAEAATLAGKSRATINRTEGGATLPDWARDLIAGKVAAEDEPAARAKPQAKRAKDAEAAPDDRKAAPAIVAALKRVPLFAKTTAEAFAMRDELARRGKVDRSTTPLIPLRPDWVTFGKYPAPVIKINAAIPRPVRVTKRGEGWSVLSADGRLYDYETAAASSRAA